MSRMSFARSGALLGCLAVATMSSTAPASAQGFFEQLFGIAPQAQAPVQVAPQQMPDTDAPIIHRPRHIAEAKPVLQHPTDLMHDKTLRVGDAVAMKDGIHVYDGRSTARHTKSEFVPLDDADELSSKERSRLAALDVTRSPQVFESRSASDIVNGVKITDARGNSVRYVGPF